VWLSPQHALQAGSQTQISDLANMKRYHTGARPSSQGSPQDAPGLDAVKDLAKMKREATPKTAYAVWARSR